MKQRRFSPVIAASLAASLTMVTASAAAARGVETPPVEKKTSRYESVDISTITGEVVDPPELTSAASALAREKEWYEYVYYSSKPVGYYYLNDTARVAFYDPYDYGSSLIMEVDDTLTDWSSNNSLSVSYTTGSSLTGTKGKSVNTESSTESAAGQDVSTTTQEKSTVTSKSEGYIHTYNSSKTPEYKVEHSDWEVDAALDITSEKKASVGGEIAGVGMTGEVTKGHTLHIGGNHNWGTETHKEVTVEDQGWTRDDSKRTDTIENGAITVTSTIADRITKATGVSVNNEISMSTENSTTITKTYDAAYFNQSGSPLQWKIIRYTVMMPLRYQLEYLIDGEWIFYEDNYCLLKTVQGTCRAWLENNTAYYEHWGTGEPVTWDDFWKMFFSKEKLIEAYQNRLYPDY